MKIRIQRTNEAISIQEKWQEHETEGLLKQELVSDNGNFFELAQMFFEHFPRFKEIVFNTELTKEYNE